MDLNFSQENLKHSHEVGGSWRINFSRVEWTVLQVMGLASFLLHKLEFDLGTDDSYRLGTHTGRIQPILRRTTGCGVPRGKSRCIFLRGNTTFGSTAMNGPTNPWQQNLSYENPGGASFSLGVHKERHNLFLQRNGLCGRSVDDYGLLH